MVQVACFVLNYCAAVCLDVADIACYLSEDDAGSRLAKWDAPGHDASSIVGPKLGNVTMWTGFGDSVIGPASITSPHHP